jgi:HEAT repeat protein
MGCRKEKPEGTGDCLELERGRQWFGTSESTWIVGQAIRYLNSDDPSDERDYQHAVSLLRAHKEGVRALAQLAHDTSQDPTLRWNLIYLLGDAGDTHSIKPLISAALEKLPEQVQENGCEGPFDTELLNRTMAIEALVALSRRHKEAAEGIVKIVSAGPARPVLIEAVKAAVDLGLQDRVRELLPEDERRILDIKRISFREVNADSEREDGREVGFTPPKHRSLHTAPHTCGCQEN